MSTAPRPKFSLAARHLGPVFSLDGELTQNDQNLAFAEMSLACPLYRGSSSISTYMEKRKMCQTRRSTLCLTSPMTVPARSRNIAARRRWGHLTCKRLETRLQRRSMPQSSTCFPEISCRKSSGSVYANEPTSLRCRNRAPINLLVLQFTLLLGHSK
jgi:hypothetical protein